MAASLVAAEPGAPDYARRVETVKKTPGFVALWDFVKREGGQFAPHAGKGVDSASLRLDAFNYVREYWGLGRAATYQDFPLLGSGPFGQAIRIKNETESDFRPTLAVPRERMHNSRLDVKGPGQSVSLVVWIMREGGTHALAGIWHEGTDLHDRSTAAKKVQPGMRQYALFAGLAANPGAVAAHVSENGRSSFGDRFARNLSVTPKKIGAGWTAAGFVFDNKRNTVTSYIDGVATDFWIEEGLEKHPFFGWPYKAWTESGENASFPKDQLYRPPEGKVRQKTVVERSAAGRVELHQFEFTKVRLTYNGQGTVTKRELVALKVNPFWFPHDLYAPKTPEEGGPFTIGRVIHSSRGVGTTGWIGGVAMFDKALSPAQMRRVSTVGRD